MGTTPVVRHVLGGRRIHLLGALAWWPQTQTIDLLMQAQKCPADSGSISHFLDALKDQIGHEAVLIWDNLSAHKSRATRECLCEHSSWLSVRFLPAYAPDLNPVEGMWSSLKSGRLAGYCPETIEQLESKVQESVEQIESEQELMRGFFVHTPLFDHNDFSTEIESHYPQSRSVRIGEPQFPAYRGNNRPDRPVQRDTAQARANSIALSRITAV